MYIKEVELKNFKSFGKSIRVPLKNDFVTVTGRTEAVNPI